MHWNKIQHIKPADFKRMTGFERATFDKMVSEINKYIAKFCQHQNRCRPHKLSIQEQLLMTIMYWREYRTMLNIGFDFGVNESTVSRTIHHIEYILSTVKVFKLPEKKKLTKANVEFGFVIVESTETRIERPKKNNKNHTLARKNITH